ncbi:glyoxalase superfamily protein [Pontivivens insulae]|uniref:Glyoxalase-related protein domain-containing protein n=1 Tax=Pontivivens insulae TaxID=1639689 RepID=A0A2R8A8J5_9RHOB|nr:glyoxalase superfamily protein [Pontivivens insulae]RED18661.1 hypothetical protein DFR53_0859 [Pontivivens insulae]SPF28559.1 hypothetical protein POI8812_00860 [Pontivivens insulae]
MKTPLPTKAQAKALARQLRTRLEAAGTDLTHTAALERIAQQHGFRDWNTMSAALSDDPAPSWSIGDRVTGKYLSHPFAARINAISVVHEGWVRLELQLDKPVDVVASEHFSSLRHRIRGTVGPKGHSSEMTSDGTPQLQIDLL